MNKKVNLKKLVSFTIFDSSKFEGKTRLSNCPKCLLGKMRYGIKVYFEEDLDKEDSVGKEVFFECDKCKYNDLVFSPFNLQEVRGGDKK